MTGPGPGRILEEVSGSRQRARRRGVWVWGGALAVHAAALAWFAWIVGRAAPAEPDPDRDGDRADPDVAFAPHAAPDPSLLGIAEVALVDERELGPLLEAAPGPADQAGFDRAHPLPRAPLDLPGSRAAGAGGGAEIAGAPVATGRRDPATLRSQIWNDPQRTFLPRQRTGERARSPESIARRERDGFGGRDSRPARARDGAEIAQRGTPGGRGAGGASLDPDLAWRQADPRFDGSAAPQVAARSPGATGPGAERPLVDRGARATEADRRGPTRDDVDSRAASSARDPMPLELSRPSAGGRAQGGGARGPADRRGPLASGAARGAGEAATRSDRPRGPGRIALRATRQDPYFRRMYERLDREVVFPRDLALALEQGEVIVTFRLTVRDGSVDGLRVVKSSGFDGFDRELTRALSAAAPFGPVPAALGAGRDHLVVTAPYWFRNPIVR